MGIYILVFGFNFFFNIFKTMEIKYTYENKVKALLINSVYINIVSLGSTYYAIERLFAGDRLVLVFFIAGSILGKWVAMTKIGLFKRRVQRVYIKLKNK
jgi:hypothetical protein